MLFALNIRLKALNAFPNKGGVFPQNKTVSTATQARKELSFNQAVQIIGCSHCCAKFGQQTALFERYYLATSCMKSTREQDAKMHTSKKHPNVQMSFVLRNTLGRWIH
jgi:hypothetical protein